MTPNQPEGLVDIDGEQFYAVPDVDQMAPFLLSIVSDGDRWMYVSSSGALTAGRADAAGAIFPYETDDRLHKAAGTTGPVTAIRVGSGDEVWTPFRPGPGPGIRRCLYKSVVGDAVILEEFDDHTGLRFRYRWSSSDAFGFIRTATLTNAGDRQVDVELIDGLMNLLPHGLSPSLYQGMSNLTNAYKRSEVIDQDTRLAVYSLEAGVVDSPEPSESLRASVAWSVGLDGATVAVDPDSFARFVMGIEDTGNSLLTGKPGAYLLRGGRRLDPGEEIVWHIVADCAQDQVAVARLRRLLRSDGELSRRLEQSIAETTRNLVDIMAPADALQLTGDRVATAHQFANVTYNVMRGGVPLAGYEIDRDDFASFIANRNRSVAERHRERIASLPEKIHRHDLLEQIERADDPHLLRLGLEYLPFSFSRRHGDPSRPWNAFSIRVRDAAGEPIVYYQGNWRDIFQNWEALCMSFPSYLPGVVSVFVNASTPDGFNPYRITRDGIDWEVPEPDDPWSNIGYWGDHQIVYLLRLLEAADRYVPGELEALLTRRCFSYADVPYRIAPYDDLVRDPKSTIEYAEDAAARAEERAARLGGDGRLVCNETGQPHLVTLAEKLLVPAMAKLANFVTGGGIWMNTQRPEWNDANNALVGYGLSMVTLYHLRRYLDHLRSLVRSHLGSGVEMSTEVADLLQALTTAFATSTPQGTNITPEERKRLMDAVGRPFSDYRKRVYEAGFSGSANVTPDAIVDLCDAALAHLDDTIRSSERSDGLYHSYNLIHFSADGTAASVEYLQEMLEGQVAVLSSGVLPASDRARVIDALFSSAMYRPDADSFMLYPARQLPSFLEKNVIPPDAVEGNPLLSALAAADETSIIIEDGDGLFRFNADFTNRDDVEEALDRLAAVDTWSGPVAAHREAVLDVYERVFNHHAYTGRSGSMYGYEGIGSIYWHMVAKLLVAAQEAVLDAAREGAPDATAARLVDAYRRIRGGLGFNKSAAEFGAMPLDPYSHSPSHAGAQQPGMTGLVKEELLTRPLETGIRIAEGEIVFDPVLLRSEELTAESESWPVIDVDGAERTVEVPAGSLGTTLCQVAIIVSPTDGDPEIEVVMADGTTRRTPGERIDRDTSGLVFARTGDVAVIRAFVESV